MALPDYFLQELKMKSDLADIAASYVNLKRRGKNLVGLCPFHNEKSPSFNIYSENGSFYCFGCQAGGDIITFIMKIENLDYIEAVKFLAQRAGIDMPENGIDDGLSKMRTRVLEVNRATARFFYDSLISLKDNAGLTYFKARGLDPKTIRKFGLGYAPDSGFALVNHLKAKGFTKDEMVQANVAGISRNGNLYDRFRGRVMFPIIDLRGNVIAFGGRILTDEKPKYINTSDTPVYHKSTGLFAMNIAKNDNGGQIILAEGYMDVIALHKAGFENSVASLGTSFTTEQARMIAKYAQTAVICYDSDEAGKKAAERAIPILKSAGLAVKVLEIPGGKDPDEFMKKYGEDGAVRFKRLLEKAPNDVEYRLKKIKEKHDTNEPEGKDAFIREAAKMLAQTEDEMKAEIYAKQIASEMEVNADSVGAVLKSYRKNVSRETRKQEKRQFSNASANASIVNGEKRGKTKAANAEENILTYLFRNPEQIEKIKENISPEKFATAYNRRVYELLLGKTIHGEISMMDFSQDLTQDEMRELSRIINERAEVPPTWKDMQDAFKILQNPASYLSPAEVKDMTDGEFAEMMKKIRNNKLGE